MGLALAIVLGWLGAALLWVAFHGIDAQNTGPAGVISTLEHNVTGAGT
jgi:hypothetical protein